MLKALSNTVAQLSEPSLRKILFYSVLLALASIVICSGLGWVLLDQFGLLGFVHVAMISCEEVVNPVGFCDFLWVIGLALV